MPKVHLISTVLLLSVMGLLFVGCEKPATEITPKPQFELSPQRGIVPLTVRFSDTSIAGVSPIQEYAWNFGDGARGTGPSPKHAYKVPGVYDVTLTITTAEGDFSHTWEAAVIAEKAGSFDDPDPDTGVVTGEGVRIVVPPALRGRVVFGIRKDAAQISLDAFEPMIVMSDTFTISHNLTPPDLFTYDVNERTEATLLSIPMVEELPVPVLDPASLQLLARLKDGRTVPIPGRVEHNNFIASVLRLPPRAQYIVVLRSEVKAIDTREIEDLYEERLDANDYWADYWRINFSDTTALQLTALYNGNMDSEASFNRRNFTETEGLEALGALGAAVQGLHNLLAEGEMKPPTLVMEDDYQFHNIILYNMHRQYPRDFDVVTDMVYYDNFFGHVVIDPAQLLAITVRNIRKGLDDPDALDIKQPFTAAMAFGEALLHSAYPTYQIPAITTTGDSEWRLPPPADRTPEGKVKPISFIQGLYDSSGIYFAQRTEELLARGFGLNEYALLSEALFFPYSPTVAGYSGSGHEFLAYLENDEDFEEPLGLVVGTLAGLNEAIEEFGEDLLLPLHFAQALLGMYLVMDEIITEGMEEVEDPEHKNLRDYYWAYAKDRAYINSTASLLRASDSLRPPYSFNEDRFSDNALAHIVFDGPVEYFSVNNDASSVLQSITPLSSRALVIDVHTLTTELQLRFDAEAWRTDDDGYGPAVAVFKEGRTGVDLSKPAGTYRDYRISDSTGDGHNDTISVFRLDADEDDCFNRVIVLVSNLHLTERNSVSVDIHATATLETAEAGALHQYVYACDPLYGWELRTVLDFTADDGVAGYLLNMTSGAWRGHDEVDQPAWRHQLAVLVPANVRENTALLFISGGRTDSDINLEEARILAEFGKASRSVVALLKAVPNQPLRFTDEDRNRSEDATIAYSYDKYMNSHEAGAPDYTWPALFPMTRAAVRAMDAIQEFMAIRPPARDVDNFVVAGASKRGWTTWLTAAVDDRVTAIMPMVIDVLNMGEQMEHHRRAYAGYPLYDPANGIFGGYSTAIKDYVDMEIFERFGTPQGHSLLQLVDPFSYRNVLTMPKYIANSTGDQFFLPDSSQFYFYDLPGANYLHYAPNTDHSLTDGLMVDQDTLFGMLAFYMAHVRNMNRFPSDDAVLPSYQWRRLENVEAPVEGGTSMRIMARLEVTADQRPLSAELWRAYAPEHRDFRLPVLGPAWEQRPVRGTYNAQTRQWRAVVEVEIPQSGWRGFMVQLRFEGPDPLASVPYVFSTPVYVVPEDIYPTPSE